MEDLAGLRVAMAQQGASLPRPTIPSKDYSTGKLSIRLYKPMAGTAAGASRIPLLIFLHGGGWILGDLDTHDACCRALCESAACAILAVGYRLAPEHPYPAALTDAYAALSWARTHAVTIGCDPDRIAIGGESAGANLAAAVTLKLRLNSEPQPAFQVLVHPATNLRLESPSICEVNLPGFSLSFLKACIRSYAGRTVLDDPLLSPLLADDLSGLAPAVVVTVECDPLRDDGELYALALAQAGVEVSLQRLPGLPHGFMFSSIEQPEIDQAFRLLGARVARYFDAA